MTTNRDAAAFLEGAEIEHASYERTNRISGTSPADNFLTYVPFVTEQYIRPYSKEIRVRDKVGPVFIQDPNQKIESVMTISDYTQGGWGTDIMHIANGRLAWFSSSNSQRQTIELRHSFARDVENDQCKLVAMDLASLQLVSVDGGRMEFEAWITRAHYYLEGDPVADPEYNIFEAVKQDAGEDGYGNSGYPYMPSVPRDGILGRNFPLRVRVVVYGAGYNAKKIWKRALA